MKADAKLIKITSSKTKEKIKYQNIQQLEYFLILMNTIAKLTVMYEVSG